MKAFVSRLSTLGVSETIVHAMLRALLVVGFTLATAAAAQVKIPVPGILVPMTLQTAIVLLAGLTLGRRDGALSQVFYIAGGALGLPFFATVGGAFLLGPTFGYLIGFVIAAAVAGSIPTRGSLVRSWLIAFAASLLVFVPGVIQLKMFMAISWEQAFMMGVVPFMIGDLIKVTLAATAHTLHKRLS